MEESAMGRRERRFASNFCQEGYQIKESVCIMNMDNVVGP